MLLSIFLFISFLFRLPEKLVPIRSFFRTIVLIVLNIRTVRIQSAGCTVDQHYYWSLTYKRPYTEGDRGQNRSRKGIQYGSIIGSFSLQKKKNSENKQNAKGGCLRMTYTHTITMLIGEENIFICLRYSII